MKKITLELNSLKKDDNDKIISGEINIKNKSFEMIESDEKGNKNVNFVKITHCVKKIGDFYYDKENDKYDISICEKGLLSLEKLIMYISNNELIYSVRDIDHFVRQLILLHKMKLRMNKYIKKGWKVFYLCNSKNSDGKDTIFTFASREGSTKESKTKYYYDKLSEYNLTHNKIFSFNDISQLEYHSKLTLS